MTCPVYRARSVCMQWIVAVVRDMVMIPTAPNTSRFEKNSIDVFQYVGMFAIPKRATADYPQAGNR